MTRGAAVGLALLAALGLACNGASAPPTPTPAPTAVSTPGLSPTPAVPPTPAPTPVPSAAPSPSPTTTQSTGAAGCPSDTTEPAVPPNAFVTSAGGSIVAGRIGSYDFCDTAADALPPKAASLTTVELGATATVALSLPAGGGFTAYRATYWTASEWQGDEKALVSSTLDAPTATTSFGGLPPGDWMLAISLTFANGDDSLYYWHVTVP